MKSNYFTKFLLICLAFSLAFTLAGCELPDKDGGSMGTNRPNSESMLGGSDEYIDGSYDEGDGNFSGGGISIGGDGSISFGDGSGSISFGDGTLSGGGYIGGSMGDEGSGTTVYYYSDGQLFTEDGVPIYLSHDYEVVGGQLIIGGVVVENAEVIESEEVPGDWGEEEPEKEEDPYAGMVWVPVGAYVPEDQVVTLEDGTRWIKYEDEYYSIHEDSSFSNVTFYTEDYDKTTRDKAQLISLYVYLSDETGWKALKHAEYSADETCIYSISYHLEEIDGELRYVSSETTYYDNGTAYVDGKAEYDPYLGMHYPVKHYSFDSSGNPDGHFEDEYYADGTKKASRGYYANGNMSYDYRYNESGIMVEEYWYSEQGVLEGHTIRDNNGDPIISTYYRDDGTYYTYETIENGTRFTSYDAYGNVTETYNQPQSGE